MLTGAKAVNFSKCGQYLIMQTNTCSVVQLVPAEFLAIPDVSLPIKLPVSSPTTIEQLAINRSPHTDLSIGSTIRDGELIEYSASEGAKILSVVIDGNVTLQIQQSESLHSQEITALPKWHGFRDATASVRLPQNTEGGIRVFLTNPDNGWLSFSNPITQLPLIVDRKTNVLKRPHVFTAVRGKSSTELACSSSSQTKIVIMDCVDAPKVVGSNSSTSDESWGHLNQNTDSQAEESPGPSRRVKKICI